MRIRPPRHPLSDGTHGCEFVTPSRIHVASNLYTADDLYTVAGMDSEVISIRLGGEQLVVLDQMRGETSRAQYVKAMVVGAVRLRERVGRPCELHWEAHEPVDGDRIRELRELEASA